MFRRKGKLPMDEQQEDVPSYPKPEAQTMGEVDPPATPPELGGGVEPKVVAKVGTIEDALQPRQPPEVQPVPTPPDIAALRAYFMELRAALMTQVAAIEELLGFIDVGDDLAVRVAKLEKFVGLKP
ncbi:MAG TPA: hypothetical protein VJO33_02385 [Gemmatimonadaceae bacterium]|nr:hypothetical protein [Gemmatimonadaceae bacterium]